MNETHFFFIIIQIIRTQVYKSAVSINTKLFATGANKQVVIDMKISFCYIV